MAELKDIIKSLAQQCNIESISTKDLAKELGTLYSQVETLENKLKAETESKSSYYKGMTDAQTALAQYKTTYVDSVESIKLSKANFEKEKFKFEVEREFIKKETEIYKELTRSLTSTVMRNENWYGGNNGGSWSKGEQSDKPNLPNVGTSVPLP
jgi:hypothetical protein